MKELIATIVIMLLCITALIRKSAAEEKRTNWRPDMKGHSRAKRIKTSE